jgi:hypothetical protein
MSTDTPQPDDDPGTPQPAPAAEPPTGPPTGWTVPAYQTGYLPASTEEQVRQAWAAHGDPAAKEPREPWWRSALVALGLAAVVAALGFPLGWLWSSISPWLPVQLSGGQAYYADPEGEQLAAQESWFMIITVAAGIILAVIVWFVLRRFRGAWTVLGLGIGSLVCGWLAWRFGHNIGRGHALDLIRHGKDGSIIKFPPNLRIKSGNNIAFWHHIPYIGGDLVYMAVAAVAVYLLIAGFSASPSLGVHRRSAIEPVATDV